MRDAYQNIRMVLSKQDDGYTRAIEVASCLFVPMPGAKEGMGEGADISDPISPMS